MIDFFLKIIGCVKIEISGENAEKLLNKSAKARLPIYNLRYSNQKIIGILKPNDFFKLRIIKRGTGVKIKILKKSGILFKIKPHSNRVGFIIGFFLFLIIINILSLFVWNVRVSGNKTVKATEITAVCEELGIKSGVLKKSIDTKITASKLLLAKPKLTWASVNIEGSVVTVNVSEAESTDRYKQKPPTNLVASADGIIEKINVISGETKVSVGDSVAKGDILVSGVRQMAGTTSFINSSGKIYAKTVRTYKVSSPLKIEKQISGKKIKKKAVEFFGLNIPLYLGTVKDDYNAKLKISRAKILDKSLPIAVFEKTFNCYKKRKISYSEDGIVKIINKEIDEKIKKDKIEEYDFIKTNTYMSGDTVTVERTISAYENIVKSQELKISK